MTKEIIIDGVDVAGCGYYDAKNDKGSWCDITCTQEHAPFFRCESMPYCHYKQLMRLEQENKDFEILTKSLYKRIEELEKENEALAFRERLYKADYEASEQENKKLKERLLEDKILDEHIESLSREDIYRSALEEIRENLVKLKTNDEDDFTYEYSKIEDKIKEVLK